MLELHLLLQVLFIRLYINEIQTSGKQIEIFDSHSIFKIVDRFT